MLPTRLHNRDSPIRTSTAPRLCTSNCLRQYIVQPRHRLQFLSIRSFYGGRPRLLSEHSTHQRRDVFFGPAQQRTKRRDSKGKKNLRGRLGAAERLSRCVLGSPPGTSQRGGQSCFFCTTSLRVSKRVYRGELGLKILQEAGLGLRRSCPDRP